MERSSVPRLDHPGDCASCGHSMLIHRADGGWTPCVFCGCSAALDILAGLEQMGL